MVWRSGSKAPAQEFMAVLEVYLDESVPGIEERRAPKQKSLTTQAIVT
jgi:hypothetical protein